MRDVVLFLLGWSVRSAFVVLCACLTCSILSRSSAAVRNVVWRFALLGVLVIPVGSMFGSKIGLNLPLFSRIYSSTLRDMQTVAAPPLASHSQKTFAPIGGPMLMSRTGQMTTVPMASSNQVAAIEFDTWARIAILYLVGVAVVLGRWLQSLIVVRRLSRSGSPLAASPYIRVVNGEVLKVPATFGWINPVVLIPKEVSRRSSERLEAIIQHEVAHLRRADWLWQFLATIMTALQWVNPAIWVLADQLKFTAEQSADNEVLNSGVAASVYASELMSFAHGNPSSVSAAIGLTTKSRIRARLDHVLEPHRNRGIVLSRTVLTLGLNALLLSVGLSSVRLDQPKTHSITVDETQPKRASADDADEFSPGAKPYVLSIGRGTSRIWPTWGMDGLMQLPGESGSLGRTYPDAHATGARPITIAFAIPHLKIDPEQQEMNESKVLVRLGGQAANVANSSGLYQGDPPPIRRSRISRHDSSDIKKVWIEDGEAHFSVPANWQSADLELGVGMRAYQKTAEWKDGTGELTVSIKNDPGRKIFTQSTSIQDGKTITEQLVSKDLPRSLVHISLSPSTISRSWRVRVFDGKGKPIQSFANRGLPDPTKPGFVTVDVTAEANPDNIHRILVEERDYKWVAIRQVPLIPKEQLWR